MQTLIQANIFFFITSIAVVLLTIGVLVLLFKIQNLVTSLNALVLKLQSMTNYASDEAESLVEDIKESAVFRLFFPRTKRHTHTHKAKDI